MTPKVPRHHPASCVFLLAVGGPTPGSFSSIPTILC